MFSKFQLVLKYINYFIKASNGKGHGVHSPFVFDFITHVLNDKRKFYSYDRIEALREQLLMDRSIIEVQDYGAGSSVMPSRNRRVKDIARWSLKSSKYARLLFRMINYYQPVNILELGTSFGITAAYLAMANKEACVHTLEGAPAVAHLARQHFSYLDVNNIYLTEGNFDETLPDVLKTIQQIDFAFIDGNHRREPVVRYFEWLLPFVHNNSILVFDDIHWSEDMEEAWNIIKSHSSVKYSIDLFFIGIIFFNADFKVKQDFMVRF